MKRKAICMIILFLMSLNPDKSMANFIQTQSVYSYDQLTTDLSYLQKTYPLEIQSIGQSHFGREIWAVKLGKGKENILFVGSHHGREWLTTNSLMKMMEEYSLFYRNGQKYKGMSSRELFDEVAIWFVPMLNPDGVMIAQQGLSSVPKQQRTSIFEMNLASLDFRKWKANGVGVDLNRQYPAGWSKQKSDVNQPFYQFYKGKRPLEAKEVQHLTLFISRIDPKIVVSFHTSGQEIFWHYKNGENTQRDYDIAQKLSELTAYSLSSPVKYARGGGLTDWIITTRKIPAFTIEMCPLVEETTPPLTCLKEEWKRIRFIGFLLAREAISLKE
ncbi:g-D-glutamyl-meso-diaminopimelate peptidase [Oikeobacillus pervagus]|uniref:G-D-glutamyl-meso-diaminopimelate peptidase n=1 Tax=Oikeobacillus pervagus TaxID=1325931 RepID=A0AAJ1T0U2_9BACI|nr:M14 family zinc carboxypeptidase [Oikeobacillus pervagus]MDQ0214717.1 g-D-glutamyl-meso-diaminopimelate peptidase [Oikeobacillus pervagus]